MKRWRQAAFNVEIMAMVYGWVVLGWQTQREEGTIRKQLEHNMTQNYRQLMKKASKELAMELGDDGDITFLVVLFDIKLATYMFDSEMVDWWVYFWTPLFLPSEAALALAMPYLQNGKNWTTFVLPNRSRTRDCLYTFMVK
ncbi:hypothetical protein QQP08_008383 [Theobroma cacao]|nr:hypothetical protein QQP08_008383 [Theobroma cacao]